MSNLRKYLPLIILIALALAAGFGLGYLMRGESIQAPIIIEKAG